MTKNNLMNASRRTALKVAGASAALVAGGVSAAEAATRSGGKRARVTPVTQRPGGQRGGQRGQHGGGQHGGAASSALVQVPMRYNESCIRLELKAANGVQAVSLQSQPARTVAFRNLPTRLSIINEGNSTLPVGTRLMVRARAQDPKTGLLLNPAVTLRVTSGQAVLPSGSLGASALVAPVDALNLDAVRRSEQTGQAGAGSENVLELRTAIPRGHRLDVQLNYQVASGVAGSALKQVHVSAVLDMAAAGLSSSFYEVQSSAVVASLN
ncbi:transcriptional initiation protein Tat [Rothia sp. HMSC065C03]|jgi:tat pathway signal sequence domain protein|uniref:transcriptional initiation protein Tat n=1 Tax=Rothia TaxID=32207 RepID=UPI0008A8F122|nr:transcriptional initiation protein Tat [Rothia sp. HMSC065C03]OHQ20861.1 transcriptional initiation protein Tat [Rothia sp. HMSC065C03]